MQKDTLQILMRTTGCSRKRVIEFKSASVKIYIPAAELVLLSFNEGSSIH